MPLGLLWNDRELQLLRDTYPILNKKQLTEIFPDRNYQAVARKASKLGITKSDNFKKKLCTDTWTEEECAILMANYATSSAEEMCILIPGRCYKVISNKAWRLGLRKYVIDSDIPKKRWRENEIKLLTENYPVAQLVKLKEMFPDRKISSISSKANSLGLRRECRRVWTDDEIDYLKRNYVHESMEYVRRNLPHRSVSSILSKASKLNLNKLRSGTYYWTKENDMKLVELFNRGLTHEQIAEKFSNKYHKYDFKYMGERLRILGYSRLKKYPDLKTMSVVDKSWISGILEGEGEINIELQSRFDCENGRELCIPYIKIANTDLDILNAVLTITGFGRIKPKSRTSHRHRLGYVWYVTSLKPVLQLCESVVDYMRSSRKKEIVQLVIKFCKSRVERRVHWNTLPYTNMEVEISKRVADLNKKGIKSSPYLPNTGAGVSSFIQCTTPKDQRLNIIGDIDKSYFVALLEGEGGASIHATNQGDLSRVVYSPYIGIANTDYTIIYEIFRITGIGNINIRRRNVERGHKVLFEWKVTSLKRVLALCESIVDNMKCNRKQKIVRLVIEFCRSRLGPFNRITTNSYSRREIEIYDEVAELNIRGQEVTHR
jgi:hypothetical protein